MNKSNGIWSIYNCLSCNKLYAIPHIMIKDEADGGEGYEVFNCPYCQEESTDNSFITHMETDKKVIKKTIFNIID